MATYRISQTLCKLALFLAPMHQQVGVKGTGLRRTTGQREDAGPLTGIARGNGGQQVHTGRP